MRSFFIFAALMLSLLSYNADADILVKAPVSPAAEELKTEFREFHFQLTDAQNGIFSYSGSSEGIRINFSADDSKIVKLNIMLDKDVIRQKSTDIIRLADRFIPHKIADKENAPKILADTLSKMKAKEETTSFKIDELIVSAKCCNDMYYIEIKA